MKSARRKPITPILVMVAMLLATACAKLRSPEARADDGIVGNRATGDQVGSGGGIAEKNVVFAYNNLDKYIALCVESDACRLTSEEKNLLSVIGRDLPGEGTADRLIAFKSGREEPGFFVIDGQIKIAKTGETVGSQIFVNLDLLYTKSPDGNIVPLPLSSAVAMLVHELGHHHGEKDHLKLDLLGSKVERMLLGHTQKIEMAPYHRDLFALAIDFDAKPSFSQLVFGDSTNLIDLSGRLAKELSCAMIDPSYKLVGFYLYNLHWGYVEPTNSVSRIWSQPVWGDVNLFCEWAPGKFWEFPDWSVKLTAHYDNMFSTSRPAVLLPNVDIEQISCDKNPDVCR